MPAHEIYSDLYVICVNRDDRCGTHGGRFVKFKPFLSYERFYKQDYESFADGQVVSHDRFVAKHRKDQLPHYGWQLFVVAYIAQ